MLKKCKHIIFLIACLARLVAAEAQQTELLYLSGKGKDDGVNWQFYCTGGMNAGKWTNIAVPSCWELQGFGKYDYGFAKDSLRGKEQGLYKRTFNASKAWKGKQVNIVFEGVMTDAEVKINGVPAGQPHQGAFYAFKYDISKLLKYGEENIIEVKVSKHSANESVNAAERRGDFWIFGGIFRPVYLEILPEIHIEDVAVDTYENGAMTADIKVTQAAGLVVNAKLYDAGGKLVTSNNALDMAHDGKYFLSCKVPSAFAWSSESPYLYKAVFSVSRPGKLLHSITKKIGFRSVVLKQQDGIYVNGVKMKFKGVNRHSFWPTSGRTTSPQISIDDVLMMKDMNMNAVRMSHYPPDGHFLDACDSLGLFVIDELAGWHGNYDDTTGAKLVQEMLVHDRNHPSVIIWANGNEGGHNFALDTLFGIYDPQKRPVIHPWQLFNGIETQHYREYNYGIGNYEHGHDIVMPTEFLHGQFDGGHGAGLEDYWDVMLKNPLSAGGFLWDFADEGVVRKDKHDSIDTDKFRGADGIVGPFHEKEGSYNAIKEIWSPVFFEHREMTNDFDGRLNIENRYHYTNLKQCSFFFTLKRFNEQQDLKKTVNSPDIKPGAKGTLQLDLPKNWFDYDVLYVTANDPFKRELFTWSFPISRPKKFAGALAMDPNGLYPSVALEDKAAGDSDSLRHVAVGNLNIYFNRTTGLLEKVKRNNKLLPFGNGPVLCEGMAMPDSVTFKQDKNVVIISAHYPKKSLISSLVWTIDPTATLKMEIHYFPPAYFTDMVGVNFSFPEKEIESVEYMGNGPYRVWKNRLKGNRFGIWHKDHNNTETGESWNYPEFKGYHSNMYWSRFITAKGSLNVYTENEDMFLRLYTPAWKTDQWHNYEPMFPAGDISFMQGIPAIGTKTQRAETTGPQGMKNIFYDYEKDPSRALKMVLYFSFNFKD